MPLERFKIQSIKRRFMAAKDIIAYESEKERLVKALFEKLMYAHNLRDYKRIIELLQGFLKDADEILVKIAKETELFPRYAAVLRIQAQHIAGMKGKATQLVNAKTDYEVKEWYIQFLDQAGQFLRAINAVKQSAEKF